MSMNWDWRPKLVHKPAIKDKGEMLLVYALWKAKNGGYGFEVMSKEDIDNHARRFSQSFASSFSPWKTNYEEMAKKSLEEFIYDNGHIDGDSMKSNWFQMENVDIFISHSHQDITKVKAFAGWLYDEFKLTAFYRLMCVGILQ